MVVVAGSGVTVDQSVEVIVSPILIVFVTKVC